MILNQLDLGGSHPFQVTHIFHVLGTELIEGYDTIIWPRGSNPRQEQVVFWLQEWQGIGGAAAKSLLATQYLIKQVEELVANRDMQPVYIQWTATAQPGAALNATDLHDGWYVINEFKPEYTRYVVSGLVQCSMTVTHVADAPPRRVALAYAGGALTTNFSGGALNLLSLPVGSTALEASVTRTAAEGSIPCILSPAASPEPVVLSTTIANIFKGGVHVYDTINTGSNPVPTSGGTFVNANWVEVFDTHHDFQGDCVLTNGLQLLLFQTGQNRLCSAYLWNTATAAANWQQYATDVKYEDNAITPGTLRSYSLVRVGPEECAVATHSSSSAPQAAQHTFRLQRGRYEARIDIKPLTQAATTIYGVAMFLAGIPKIVYNSGAVTDDVLSEAFPAVQTDYGYGAAFINNTAQPYILGFLYQNQPGSKQPSGDADTGDLIHGDNTSLAINAQRSYGFFAIPYGVSGTYSTANLQAEAESGTLGTGWTSVADAAASGGNTAKCASGTLASNSDVFGTSFSPAAGVYDVWMRLKVTSTASTVAQMNLGYLRAGLFNNPNYGGAPSQFSTSYAWYRVATGVSFTGSQTFQFEAITGATLATDFFIDEAALVPKTLTTANTGPQELWQEFAYDRSTRLVRP